MSLLEVDDLRTGYGAVPALHGVSFSVGEGSTAVMLGLNGAGKTTTLLSVAGLLKPWSGRISFDGEDVTKADARTLVRRGLVLVPEGRHVFPGMSVFHNLRLGAWPRRRDRRRFKQSLEMAYEIFPVLQERRHQLAGTLSGGEQQMLALARGLMAGPRLLLIDEASLGLSPKLAQEVFQAVRRISREGVTVFMVEQNAGILRYVDRAFVMEKGRITFDGQGSEVLEHGTLRSAYLGAPA
ncbi:MAG TPA: ABC transporter ATP-binding protein [Actinomycetota bacterium]